MSKKEKNLTFLVFLKNGFVLNVLIRMEDLHSFKIFEELKENNVIIYNPKFKFIDIFSCKNHIYTC